MTETLRLEDLDTFGDWVAFESPAGLERAYRDATGWEGPEAPRGLASVVGRLAYTAGRSMPPGGVLVEMTLRDLGALPEDGRYDVRLSHEVLGERAGRRRVRVAVNLRRADGAPVADAGYLLDWPPPGEEPDDG
jgi:hypothetical protein